MKKSFIVILLTISLPMLAGSLVSLPRLIREDQSIGYIVGYCLPGLLALIFFLVLRESEKKPKMRLWLIGIPGILLAGIVLVAFLGRMLIFEQGEPWTHHVQAHDVDITLPSASWQSTPPEPLKRDLAFANSRLRCVVGFDFVSSQSRKLYETLYLPALTNRLKANKQKFLDVTEEHGETPAGAIYHLWLGRSPTDTGDNVFVAFALAWCPINETIVEMVMEGGFAASGDGDPKDFFTQKYEDAARSIVKSLK